jgi:hypothetical protein
MKKVSMPERPREWQITSRPLMSAFGSVADTAQFAQFVRYVPIADMVTLGDDGIACATDAPLRVE